MASTSQTNGIPPSSGSQTNPNTQTSTLGTQPATQTTTTSATNGAAAAAAPQQQTSTQSATGPRPRDSRLIELLLTSQGVTAYEQRVPLLLLDFAYRHTSSVLSDAIHLSGDPYVSQAGSKPSAASGVGAMAPPGGDATVSANAVKLAIGARLSYQFRGGSAGGGLSKEYMQELARERNKVALPKIVPSEWGVRLPSERFVLSGTSWGLKDVWEDGDMDDDDESMAGADAMEGVEGPDLEDVGGDGVEGGTVDDVFGNDVDEEMAEE